MLDLIGSPVSVFRRSSYSWPLFSSQHHHTRSKMAYNKRKRDDYEDEGKAKVVADHYNHVPEVGIVKRMDSRIFHMRNFNNWTKSMIIDETLRRIKENRNDWRTPISVLDIGCGKGGDLRKYKIGKIRHLICTDIAETSLSQAEDRYREMQSFSQQGRNNFGNRGGWNRGHQNNGPPSLFTAEFIHADATRERLREKFRDRNTKVDMVSVQFAFHYCFESLPQVEQMLQNISENLVDGGYVIGTTPDANEIMRRVKECGKSGVYTCPSKPCGQGDEVAEGSEQSEAEAENGQNYGSFGNSIYSISFKEGILKPDEPPPLFGAEYNFHLEEVVDCPEFLVHFPCLENLAAKHGLKLVYKQRFDHFYHRMKSSSKDGADLLKRMKALETYPAFHGANLGTSPDDYTHAQKELERIKEDVESERAEGDRGNDRRGRIPIGTSIGTLSKSEWEAITLYLVFVFQKQGPGGGDERRPDSQDESLNKKPRTDRY